MKKNKPIYTFYQIFIVKTFIKTHLSILMHFQDKMGQIFFFQKEEWKKLMTLESNIYIKLSMKSQKSLLNKTLGLFVCLYTYSSEDQRSHGETAGTVGCGIARRGKWYPKNYLISKLGLKYS